MTKKTSSKTDGQLARIRWFHEKLKEGAYVAPEDVAEHFGIPLATASKDIEHFRKNFNAPIAYDVSRKGFFYSDRTYSLPETCDNKSDNEVNFLDGTVPQVENSSIDVKELVPNQDAIAEVSQESEKAEKTKTNSTTTKTLEEGVEISASRVKGDKGERKKAKGKFISEKELVSIVVAEQIMKQYRDSPFADAIKSAFAKFTSILSDTVSYDLDSLNRILTLEIPSFPPVDLYIYSALIQAIQERETVILKYFSGQKATITDKPCDPCHIINYKDNWYLVAFCHEKQDYRDFLMNRIVSVEFTGTNFIPNEKFSIEEHKKNSQLFRGMVNPIEVVVEFDKYAAHWIRIRQVHPTQKITERSDGSLEIAFSVYSYENILRWVLSFGEHARILAPAELQERVRKTISRMNYLYNRL